MAFKASHQAVDVFNPSLCKIYTSYSVSLELLLSSFADSRLLNLLIFFIKVSHHCSVILCPINLNFIVFVHKPTDTWYCLSFTAQELVLLSIVYEMFLIHNEL